MLEGTAFRKQLLVRSLVVLSVFLTVAFPQFSDARRTAISSELKTVPPYYGDQFPEAFRKGVKNEALIKLIRDVLINKHQKNQGRPDSIVENCDSAARGCYGHNPIGYTSARKIILGELHLERVGGSYGIGEVYCARTYTKADFSRGPAPGPGVIVDNTIVNIEHTWPQSRFNSRMNPGVQKCDLHHLFPTDSKLNSVRGNVKFGEVDNPSQTLPCPESHVGNIQGEGGIFFEPPDHHKGNVARALFYFSIRYQINIDPVEEKFLRKWHKEDPIDTHEVERNNRIQLVQGNRNPFIDFPELTESISDF